MTATHSQCHTEEPMFPCDCAYGVEHTWKIQRALIHVLMHVHILNKVWEQKWDDCNTNTLPPMFPCYYAKGFEVTLGVRWTYIHVLMHIHILTKLCNKRWSECNKQCNKEVPIFVKIFHSVVLTYYRWIYLHEQNLRFEHRQAFINHSWLHQGWVPPRVLQLI